MWPHKRQGWSATTPQSAVRPSQVVYGRGRLQVITRQAPLNARDTVTLSVRGHRARYSLSQVNQGRMQARLEKGRLADFLLEMNFGGRGQIGWPPVWRRIRVLDDEKPTCR